MDIRIKLKRDIHIPVNTPLSGKHFEQFAGRQDLIQQLTDAIIRRGEGHFLIAGYRGVGISSLINKVTGDLTKCTNALIVPLYFSEVQRPEDILDKLAACRRTPLRQGLCPYIGGQTMSTTIYRGISVPEEVSPTGC